VLRVDSFGNLITNFRAEDLPVASLETGNVQFAIGTHSVTRLVDTFAKGGANEPFAYIGSNGFVEIGVNRASAAKSLGVGRGAQVVLGS
jgi:S-adenosylmethionine hydrolase